MPVGSFLCPQKNSGILLLHISNVFEIVQHATKDLGGQFQGSTSIFPTFLIFQSRAFPTTQHFDLRGPHFLHFDFRASYAYFVHISYIQCKNMTILRVGNPKPCKKCMHLSQRCMNYEKLTPNPKNIGNVNN